MGVNGPCGQIMRNTVKVGSESQQIECIGAATVKIEIVGCSPAQWVHRWYELDSRISLFITLVEFIVRRRMLAGSRDDPQR
jgi:hypothetical protein